MSESSLLTDELRAWIGREVSYTMPEELSQASIRLFLRAIGDDNPLYRDEAFAQTTRYGGIIAPPTLVVETGQIYDLPLDEMGYAAHEWPLPIPESRTIRGGNDYEFFQPVRPTDRITATWKIADIYEKQTRSGGPMLFVISEVTYRNQASELLATNRETIIYQPRAAQP